MRLKHGSFKQDATDGFWKRMKARTANVWERAKKKTTYALAGAAVVATLAGACDKSPGSDPQPDAAVQVDSGIDAGPDAGYDSGIPDSGPRPTGIFENLIGDHINRQLGDREANSDPADVDQAYQTGGPDTNENANPFTNGMGGVIGPTEVFMYRIGAADASDLGDTVVLDNDAGNNYPEKQAIWIRGENRFDSDPDKVVGKVDFIAYSVKFGGPGFSAEIGIPVCTDASVDGDYNECKYPGGNHFDATESHRLMIDFLGEEWVVTHMSAPERQLSTEQEVVNGGRIRLAKEAASWLIQEGESVAVDNIRFKLEEILIIDGSPAAIIETLDANDAVLHMDLIIPGETKHIMVNGITYMLHAYAIAPGITPGARWINMAVLSREMELVDGHELDLYNGTNPGYQVTLGWKNHQPQLGSLAPDSLRTIVIYSDSMEDISSNGSDILEEGEYLSIIQEPEAWRFGYAGLSLVSADMQTLRFELKTNPKMLTDSQGPFFDGSKTACTIDAPYVLVTSDSSGPTFSAERQDAAGLLSDDAFLVVLSNGGACVNEQGTILSLTPGTILMRTSPNAYDYGIVDGSTVEYAAVGDGTPSFAPPNGGVIAVDTGETGGLVTELLGSAGADCIVQSACIDPLSQSQNRPNVMFAVSESSGAGSTDYHVFGVAMAGTGDAADATFSFDSYDAAGPSGGFLLTSDNQEILYGHATANSAPSYYSGPISTGPVSSGMEMVEEGYVSERGSRFTLMDGNRVEFHMAKTLGKGVWFLLKPGQ